MKKLIEKIKWYISLNKFKRQGTRNMFENYIALENDWRRTRDQYLQIRNKDKLLEMYSHDLEKKNVILKKENDDLKTENLKLHKEINSMFEDLYNLCKDSVYEEDVQEIRDKYGFEYDLGEFTPDPEESDEQDLPEHDYYEYCKEKNGEEI